MQTIISGSTLQSGKYTIKKVLGQGGFGITYLAEHTLLGIDVAIKEFFMKDFCDRDENTCQMTIGSAGIREQVDRFKDKFLKEARNIAKLRHPNIVRIQDVFEENGTAYYVMDYCEGASLADLIKDHPSGLPESVALKYIKQVASALQYMHEEKMNHLDVKPANILLDKHDNAILIDFGLAKQYDAQGGQTSTTPVGISHGYAPIEQYKDGGVREFSPQTDIYALGATLYKLLTGVTPPQAGELINGGFPALPLHLSISVKNAIEKAMEVKMMNRPENITNFLSLLTCEYEEEETQLLPSSTENLLDTFEKKKELNLTKGKKRTKMILILIFSVLIVFGVLYYCFEVVHLKTNNTNIEERELEQNIEKQIVPFKINSEPSKSNFYINNKYYGQTPYFVSLAPGVYYLRVSHEGFKDWQEVIDIEKDKNNEISVKLEPQIKSTRP